MCGISILLNKDGQGLRRMKRASMEKIRYYSRTKNGTEIVLRKSTSRQKDGQELRSRKTVTTIRLEKEE